MATTSTPETTSAQPILERPVPHIIAHAVRGPHEGWASWFTTTDHKKIGIMYLYTVLVFFVLGGVEALLIRLQLGTPENTLVTPEVYNQLFTMHGTTMIFLVIVPVWAGFANYLLPLMIGARDVAFPRLNAWSYWMFLFGGLALYASFFFSPPEAGWTSYTPLSSKEYSPSNGQEAWIYMVHLTGLSSLLGAVNFIATIHNMRAPGMGWGRLPLFVWTILIYAYLIVIALASLAATVTMLLLDRNFGTAFFDPVRGGSPLLWQHLFWFFGHPEVYIAILPGMGVVSQILSTFARKPIFGYRAMVWAILGIAILSTSVWGHHMFISGINPYTVFAFSLLTVAIGVPSAIKTFNWLGTIWGGRVQFKTANLFSLGFVSLFVSGGITGIFLAQPSVDLPLHDTSFVVAHFHLVMGVAAIFGMFAGTFYWFPKMFGRMMDETMGKIHFWITLVGVYCIFFPMHFMGFAGQPRRYADISSYKFLADMPPLHLFITVAAFITAAAQLIFLFNIFWSMAKGRKAEKNPWRSTTLEWTVASPPPFDNFLGVMPVVHQGPYEYSVPGAKEDFVMQTDSGVPVGKH